MSHEIETLVQAIESLRQEANPFKDYLFPVIGGAFSALLGFAVAYFTLRYQENTQTQKDKINNINDWMLLADGAIASLITIKSTYHGKLENNPFQRTLSIRSMLQSKKRLDKNLSSLSFIIPREEDKKSQEVKWRQLPKIRAMIENYNYVIELWNKRSEIERPITERIVQDYGTLGFVNVTREQIFKSVNPSEFITLIDLTEKAIKLTDDLIIELQDFMMDFPEIGKSLINEKYLKKFGFIIILSTETNAKIFSFIDKSPEVDYKILAELFGQTEEQVKNEYITGYEQ